MWNSDEVEMTRLIRNYVDKKNTKCTMHLLCSLLSNEKFPHRRVRWLQVIWPTIAFISEVMGTVIEVFLIEIENHNFIGSRNVTKSWYSNTVRRDSALGFDRISADQWKEFIADHSITLIFLNFGTRTRRDATQLLVLTRYFSEFLN